LMSVVNLSLYRKKQIAFAKSSRIDRVSRRLDSRALAGARVVLECFKPEHCKNLRQFHPASLRLLFFLVAAYSMTHPLARALATDEYGSLPTEYLISLVSFAGDRNKIPLASLGDRSVDRFAPIGQL